MKMVLLNLTKKFFSFISVLGIISGLSSCRDNSFDWDKAHSNMTEVENAYEEHFKEIFGEVSPTQSWDFTQTSGTRALTTSVISTFGEYNGSGKPNSNNSNNNWFGIPDAINDWLNSNMKEQVDNRSKGKNFSFIVPPTKTFDLIPIYQGLANSYWDMYAVVKNKNGVEEEIKFWEKNQGIEIQQNNVTWNENVFYLVNRDSKRYLRSSNKQFKVTTRNDAQYDYDYQFFIDFSDKSYQGKNFTLVADVHATDRSAKIYGQTHSTKGVYAANFGDIEVGTSWKTIIMTGTFPSTGGVIALPLANDRNGNTFYFDNIAVYVDNNNVIDVAKFYTQQKGTSGFVEISPETTKDEFHLTEKTSADCWHQVSDYWKQGVAQDVYNTKYSGEMGLRFGVVSIKTNNIENKYLLAFLNKPEDGRFVTVDNNGRLVTKLAAEECLPVNSYGGYYDQYLVIGDYFIYEENGDIRAARYAKQGGGYATRPWEVSDISSIDRSKFRWDAVEDPKKESLRRYRYEDYKVVGGDDNVYSIRKHYNSSNASSWVNVRMDVNEMTMGSEEEDKTVTLKPTRTKGIHFEFPEEYIGCEVYFYWKTRSPFYRANTAEGARLTSKTQMLAINYPSKLPAVIPDKKNIMVIGCEAGVLAASETDYDFNDMVFLLVSDDNIEFNEVPEIVEKRYMVEDLGATDDIDFNDMVVDVKQTTIKKYRYVSGNLETLTPSITQEVILRAMGGTLDFDFKVGNNVIFTKSKIKDYKTMYMTGMKGGKSTTLDDYDCVLYHATLIGNPWDPSTNNVSFTVYKEGTSTAAGGSGTAGNSGQVNIDNNGSYNITFPNIGDAAPRIIAFPVTKLWRDERHECCNEWLYDREPALWEMPENAPDANKNTHTESFSNWISSHRSEYLNWVETKFSTKVKNSIATWLNQKYNNTAVEQ